MGADAFKTTDCDYRPRFCEAPELATRLGLPLDFIEAETKSRHLCYIEIDDRKLYNVDVAEQEIMHTAQLSNPPEYRSSVPWVISTTKQAPILRKVLYNVVLHGYPPGNVGVADETNRFENFLVEVIGDGQWCMFGGLPCKCGRQMPKLKTSRHLAISSACECGRRYWLESFTEAEPPQAVRRGD